MSLSDPRVLVRRAFLDERTCAGLRLAMDVGGHVAAEIYDAGYVVDELVRRTADVEVDPVALTRVENAIALARDDLGNHFGLTLTHAEGAGFLRYREDGFYRAHRDCLPATNEYGARRLSIVIFLTGTCDDPSASTLVPGCDGGALRVYSETGSSPVDILPSPGMLVAFPAHLVHEVLPVTRGIRDVVVDWLY